MASHNRTGQKGELIAREWLIKEGHTILETNWRFDRAEVDIISAKNGVLIFTEVKTRSTEYFGLPAESVSSQKEQLLAKAAQRYVEEIDWPNEIRFDIISIVLNEMNYQVHQLPDAFFPVDEGPEEV